MSECQNPHRSLEANQSLIDPILKEPVERYGLANGLTVVLKPDRSNAICSVQVWVKTGSIHEDDKIGAGLSHYLEHMLFKGTEKRGGREISENVQSAGGYINAYTTFDRTVYYIDIPSENVDVALDVLSDSVFRSTLPEDEVEKERGVILREIDMGEDDPDHKLSRALFETSFKEHPYRYPIIGYKELFSQVTREDLVAYYDRRYSPNNAVLIVAGDFETSDMKKRIERDFGTVTRKTLPSVFIPSEPMQLAERECHLYEDVQITRAGIGFQTPGLTHPDTPALDALSMILGHGNSSMLSTHLREELKLVHAIDASNWTPGSVGVFYLALVCDPDKRDEAINELHSYLGSLTVEDFSTDRVDKAVRQLIVAEINARKTVSGQASKLGAAEVVIGDIGYAENYLRKISRVTPEDLIGVLKKWLRKERLTTITLNPKSAQVSDLKSGEEKQGETDFIEFNQRNGSKLLLRENDRLPNTHFRVVMNAGSLYEQPGKQGATSLLATLLTKDTEKRSSVEVAEAIESVGGSFYEFSGNNSLGLALDLLPSNVDLALDLIEQALLHPIFKDETFTLEKAAHMAAIKEDLDEIVTAGRKILRKRFFGDHPFSIGGAGSLESVGSLATDDIKELRSSLLTAGNVTIAVSGQFDTETLKPRLEALLEKLPSGGKPVANHEFKKPSSPGEHREPMDRQQAVVFHAYLGPGLLDKDFYVSELADEIFSGMSSNLFEKIREELSLAYFVRSSRIVGLDTAMFYFYAGTSTEGYPRVIEELVKEVKRVSDGDIALKELDRCKTRLKASRRMSMQTNSSCASHAALNVAYGLPANDWRSYDERIDAVSIQDLANFASKYFREEERVELVIGALE